MNPSQKTCFGGWIGRKTGINNIYWGCIICVESNLYTNVKIQLSTTKNVYDYFTHLVPMHYLSWTTSWYFLINYGCTIGIHLYTNNTKCFSSLTRNGNYLWKLSSLVVYPYFWLQKCEIVHLIKINYGYNGIDNYYQK